MPEGRCLCGALRFEADPPFQFMVNCHCSMCRKHHGSAFATFIAVPPAAFRWISGEANVGVYESSENAARAFCRVCGSVAPHLLPSVGQIIIPGRKSRRRPRRDAATAHFRGLACAVVRDHRHPASLGGVSARLRRDGGRPATGDAARRSGRGQLSVRRRRVRDARHAAVHEELPLLALSPRTRRRARHERVLPGRCVSLDTRRDTGGRLRAARRALLRHGVLSTLRQRVAARVGRPRIRRRAGGNARCRSGHPVAPSTSSRARRLSGSKSPTVFRSTTSCPRLRSAPRLLAAARPGWLLADARPGWLLADARPGYPVGRSLRSRNVAELKMVPRTSCRRPPRRRRYRGVVAES